MAALVASAPRGFHSSCNPIAGFICVMIPPGAESRLNGFQPPQRRRAALPLRNGFPAPRAQSAEARQPLHNKRLGLAARPQVQCVEEAIERVWPTWRNIHRRLRAICIRDCVGICGRGPGVGPWFGIRDLGSWFGTYDSDLLGLGVVLIATDNLASLF